VFAPRGRHVANSRGVQIPGRDDGVHALHATSRIRIDRAHLAVRHPTADHNGKKLLGAVKVIGIATFAAQQDGIFLARHRLADGEFLGRQQRRIERRIHRDEAFVT
jgi:hypothetical protein